MRERRTRWRRGGSWALFGVVAVAVGACGGDAGPTGPQTLQDLTFASWLDIDLTRFTQTSSGLLYQDVVDGTGPGAQEGDVVDLALTGLFPDGRRFHFREEYHAYQVGNGGTIRFIPGVAEGIRGMKEGGTRTLIVPPDLAYGSEGLTDDVTHEVVIPPWSWLLFRIEILNLTPAG